MHDINTIDEQLDMFFAERAFSPRTEEQYRSILFAFLNKVTLENCTVTEVQKFLRNSGWGNSRQYVASVDSSWCKAQETWDRKAEERVLHRSN